MLFLLKTYLSPISQHQHLPSVLCWTLSPKSWGHIARSKGRQVHLVPCERGVLIMCKLVVSKLQPLVTQHLYRGLHLSLFTVLC